MSKREYSFTNKQYRDIIDLQNYEELITRTVKTFCPRADVTVTENSYIISPEPTRAESIQIGRQLAKSELADYCMLVCALFRGHSIHD